MTSDNTYDSYSGIVVAKTKKAALIDFGTGEVWVPLSVMTQDSAGEIEDAERGDSLDIEIASWFAEKELK